MINNKLLLIPSSNIQKHNAIKQSKLTNQQAGLFNEEIKIIIYFLVKIGKEVIEGRRE